MTTTSSYTCIDSYIRGTGDGRHQVYYIRGAKITMTLLSYTRIDKDHKRRNILFPTNMRGNYEENPLELTKKIFFFFN
jgi:hypothetical protein